MEILVNVITILTVGFAVLVVGYGIIGKVFDERRKDSKEAAKLMDIFIKKAPELIKSVVNEFKKIDEEEKEEKRKAYQKSLRKEFEGLDALDDDLKI